MRFFTAFLKSINLQYRDPVPGEDWFPLSEWPQAMQAIWMARGHPKNLQRFQLFCFFLANGVPATTARDTILRRWPDLDLGAKNQLNWLTVNYTNKLNEWYAFDIVSNRLLYLSGDPVRND